MYNNFEYPQGSDNPQAPWNRTSPKEAEFQVLCSQTLSKTVPVFTDNYTPICEKEIDCDGFITTTMDTDTSDINWEEELFIIGLSNRSICILFSLSKLLILLFLSS